MTEQYIKRSDAIWITDAYSLQEEQMKDLPILEIHYGYWAGMDGDQCSECGRYLSEIMDSDSYYAIGFNPNQLVACPFCGAFMNVKGKM